MADHEELLNILNAHGQQFLSSFPESVVAGKKRKRSQEEQNKAARKDQENTSEDEESEWGGINDDSSSGSSEGSEGDDSDLDENDDEFAAGSSTGNSVTSPDVIVFSDPSRKDTRNDKSQMKAFMSSKIAKISQDLQPQKMKKSSEEDNEEERTNLQNDALLHKLVHTKLLSGSLNTELDLTPAQRRKALSGRILELAGDARLGRGEKSLREAERNKASKRVREGLVAKAKKRQKAKLEEAKNLGTYHPSLKKLFEQDLEAKAIKRQRGLQMGVGKFRAGTLQLSRQEVQSIQGHPGKVKSDKGRRR